MKRVRPPAKFTDTVQGMIHDYLGDAADYLKQYVIDRMKLVSDEVDTKQVEARTDILLQDMFKACDRNLDKFEIYLERNIFNIPEGLNIEKAKHKPEENAESGNSKEDEEERLDAVLAEQRHKNEELASRNAKLKWSNESCEEALLQLSKQLEEVAQINMLLDEETIERVVNMKPEVQLNSEKCSDLIRKMFQRKKDPSKSSSRVDLDEFRKQVGLIWKD